MQLEKLNDPPAPLKGGSKPKKTRPNEGGIKLDKRISPPLEPVPTEASGGVGG